MTTGAQRLPADTLETAGDIEVMETSMIANRLKRFLTLPAITLKRTNDWKRVEKTITIQITKTRK